VSKVRFCMLLVALSVFGPVHEAYAIKRETVERTAIVAGLVGVAAGAAAIRAGAIDSCTRACGVSDIKRYKQYLFGTPVAGMAAYVAAYASLWQWYKKTEWPRDEAERVTRLRLENNKRMIGEMAQKISRAERNEMVLSLDDGVAAVIEAAYSCHLRSICWLVEAFDGLYSCRSYLKGTARCLRIALPEMNKEHAQRAQELIAQSQPLVARLDRAMKILRADKRYDEQFRERESLRLQAERDAAERARRDAEYARQQAEQARCEAERACAANEDWHRWDRWREWWSGGSYGHRPQRPEINVNVHSNAGNNAGTAHAHTGTAQQVQQPDVHIHHTSNSVQSSGVASSGPIHVSSGSVQSAGAVSSDPIHCSSGSVKSVGVASSGPVQCVAVAQVRATSESRQRRRRTADDKDEDEESSGN